MFSVSQLQRQQSIKIDNMDAAELLRMAGASGGGSKRQDLEVGWSMAHGISEGRASNDQRGVTISYYSIIGGYYQL